MLRYIHTNFLPLPQPPLLGSFYKPRHGAGWYSIATLWYPVDNNNLISHHVPRAARRRQEAADLHDDVLAVIFFFNVLVHGLLARGDGKQVAEAERRHEMVLGSKIATAPI